MNNTKGNVSCILENDLQNKESKHSIFFEKLLSSYADFEVICIRNVETKHKMNNLKISSVLKFVCFIFQITYENLIRLTEGSSTFFVLYSMLHTRKLNVMW